MTSGATMLNECRICNTPTPKLYALPQRARHDGRVAGPACFFCFIRATGIKPTRRQLVTHAEQTSTSATG
jgi:hypothetical protein